MREMIKAQEAETKEKVKLGVTFIFGDEKYLVETHRYL